MRLGFSDSSEAAAHAQPPVQAPPDPPMPASPAQPAGSGHNVGRERRAQAAEVEAAARRNGMQLQSQADKERITELEEEAKQ